MAFSLSMALLVLRFKPRLIVVTSTSMVPTLNPMDATLVVEVPPHEIRVGDIIAYVQVQGITPSLVMHRVVEVVEYVDKLNRTFFVYRTRGGTLIPHLIRGT